MEYAKHLLNKENVKLDKFETFAHLFEMLTNQQEIKNVGRKSMSLIKELKGDVALCQVTNDSLYVVHSFGDREELETRVNNRSIIKKISKNLKPLFGDENDDFHMILPILSKDDFLGALFIYEEQEINCWEEIYTLLHLSSLVFKYYNLAEESKLNNVKDNVTDLFNYRHFQDQLELELEKATRYHIPLSLVMIDIESFKMINDKLGYDAGDEVLRQLSKLIEKSCRKIDMPARLNADTFAILLSNTDEKGAYIVLNRVLLKLKRHKFKIGGKEFKVKVKSSATQYELHDVNGEKLLSNSKDNLAMLTVEDTMKIIEQSK